MMFLSLPVETLHKDHDTESWSLPARNDIYKHDQFQLNTTRTSPS